MNDETFVCMGDTLFFIGAVDEPIENQANVAGYTFGDHAEQLQKAVDSINNLYVRSLITDGEYSKIRTRLHKQMKRFLKPIKEEK